MVGKERFVEYINFIKDLRQKEKEFNNGLARCFGEDNCGDIAVYANVETEMIKMLCDMMDIEYNEDDMYGDDIQYFIYELNFGENGYECIEIGGKKISLTTAEELYNYILSWKDKE